jgi:hypothetical protein
MPGLASRRPKTTTAPSSRRLDPGGAVRGRRDRRSRGLRSPVHLRGCCPTVLPGRICGTGRGVDVVVERGRLGPGAAIVLRGTTRSDGQPGGARRGRGNPATASVERSNTGLAGRRKQSLSGS